MRIDEAFVKLGRSRFRSRFGLNQDDVDYLNQIGPERCRAHAADFVAEKLAPADPAKDGRQTPMRGHPVFKAMHGTAMCCRGCMERWWHVRKGVALTSGQQERAVRFLMAWIGREMKRHGENPRWESAMPQSRNP